MDRFEFQRNCSVGLAWLIFPLLFAVALVLVGCDRSSEPELMLHTRDASAPDVVAVEGSTAESDEGGETRLLTEAPSPTEIPPSPTGMPVSADEPPAPTEPGCDHAFFFEPSPQGCPFGAHQDSAAAEQPFEHGFMIWLEVTDSVYVFDWDGGWHQFEDRFEEGQPEFDPEIAPPSGLYQPVRGFGKVWRENPQVRELLGWARGRELGFDSQLQVQNFEEDIPPIIFVQAFNGHILALTERTPGQGDWVIATS